MNSSVSADFAASSQFHVTYVWNGLGKWAATLAKETPLFVEGELVYERYARKVESTIGKKILEVKRAGHATGLMER